MKGKHILGYGACAAVILLQGGVISKLASQASELEERYAMLYEMAAYLAGKASQAGFELDEEDMGRMKELKPA